MYFLCTYTQLQKTPILCIDLDVRKVNHAIIVLLHNRQVRAFRNLCPHAWVPLNQFNPDLLSGCQQYLQCSSHFAQFTLLDGYCVYGPCQGQSLLKYKAEIVDEDIFIHIP